MAEKILVVDDDLDTLRLVGLMLERQGYQIVASSTGRQALELANSEHPDLILLDLMMPDIDGVEVARQLRSDPATKDILIIMFTAKSQVDDKLEGFDAGADDYLTKPTQPRELMAHVKAVLKRGKPVKTISAKEFSERGQVIGLIGPKGGIGVSTLAVNLGIALHNLEKKSVVVADFRPGCGTIGLELGFSISQGMKRLMNLSPGEINPSMVEAELTDHPLGVRFLLSSPQPQDARMLSSVENFQAIAQCLPFLANYILLDLSPGITPVNEVVLKQCDRLIVVVEPILQTIIQAKLLLNYLIENGFDEGKVTIALVNRLRSGIQLPLGQVQDKLGRNVSVVFTAVPELAYQAQLQTTPMVLLQPDGVPAQQFNSLAQKVILQRVT